MIEKLIRWAVQNRLIVVLLAFALLGYGLYAFNNINVEAYPDPRRPSWKSWHAIPARRRKKWNARSRSRSRWPWRGCRA